MSEETSRKWTPKIIEGNGPEFSYLERAQRFVRFQLLGEIINRSTGAPRFSDLNDMNHALRRLRFLLAEKHPYGPEGGWQLIYVRYIGHYAIFVKIKTRGYRNGNRSRGTMSIGLGNRGVSWQQELCKFDAYGNIIAKRKLERIPGRPVPFDLFIQPGSADLEAFADRGHLDFSKPFDDNGIEFLRVDTV